MCVRVKSFGYLGYLCYLISCTVYSTSTGGTGWKERVSHLCIKPFKLDSVT